ncbi:MAG: ATP synthase F1 subunit delta [Myxococcales bacterium]|nr:ATP synthase F1 subunit delta [Myxococcales bacterium]
MITGSLARRYARAMLDIGVAKGTYEQLGRELDDLAKTYAGSRDLGEALTNPVFPRAQRRDVLVATLEKVGVSPVTRNFALLLLERERIPFLPAIARELRLLVDEQAGRVRATVTSARPLAADHVQGIRQSLEQQTGKTVVLETREDPSLLGGVVAQLGDVVYDGSLRTQLEQMRERVLHE